MELRVVMIGGWGHSSGVLEEMEALGGVKLLAMATAVGEDPSHFRRFAVAKDAPLYDDYRKMLAEVKPNLVIIGTRLDEMTAIAIECANAGCHIICEKPLATTHAKLAALYDAVAKNRVQCVPMLSNRLNPGVRAAREIIDRGELGTVALVNARKTYKWGDRPVWFGRREMYGGTIGWIGIHALDFVQAATGEQYVSVAAMQSNVAHPERAECEDNCAMVLRLSGGGNVSISLDLLRPNAAETWGGDWLRIVGSRGEIEADLERRTVHVTTQDAPRREVALGERMPAFVPFLKGLIAGGGANSPDMARGFVLSHVCLCARDAADKGETVALDRDSYRDMRLK